MSSKQPSNGSAETYEPLLDVFKAAALSVTKLYKTSALSQSQARQDGYQDCLDSLLAFLDRENIGLDDGEGWRIRSWAAERLQHNRPRDSSPPQVVESEDEGDKPDSMPSPELLRTNSGNQTPVSRPPDVPPRSESTPPNISGGNNHSNHNTTNTAGDPIPITAPTLDTFTFSSAYPNIATLDLSDTRAHDNLAVSNPSAVGALSNRPARIRHGGNGNRAGLRSTNGLGKGAGQKRKINFSEIFDLGSLGGGNVFGGSKKSRHV